MILISILVHEKSEVILDQIANFQKFAPEAILIIHPSRQFAESEPGVPAKLGKIPGVMVNPQPFYTGTGMVLKCHVSNYLFAIKAGIQFSHFCLHSSNDMFVRRGVEAYIREKNYGFFQFDLSIEKLGFSHWKDNFHSDKTYEKILREAGSEPTRLVSQVEGTFYPNEVFGKFARSFKRHGWEEIPWPLHYVHGTNLKLVNLFEKIQRSSRWRKHVMSHFYTKEEFYPPNYFSLSCKDPASPYCYMNWENNLFVTASEIENICKGTLCLGQYEEIYSVKRFERSIEDPIRKLIGTLE